MYIKDQEVIKRFWPIFFEFPFIQLPFITTKLPSHVTVIYPGSPISMLGYFMANLIKVFFIMLFGDVTFSGCYDITVDGNS